MFAFVRILKSKDTDTSPKLDNDATYSSLYKECEKSSWKWLQIKLDIPNVATTRLQCQLFGKLSRFSQPSPAGGRLTAGTELDPAGAHSQVHHTSIKGRTRTADRAQGSPMLAPPWAWEPLLRLAGNSLGAGALRRSVLQAASDHFHECVLM